MTREQLWDIVRDDILARVSAGEQTPAEGTATIRELLCRANRWDWLAEMLSDFLDDADIWTLIESVSDEPGALGDVAEVARWAADGGLMALVSSATALPAHDGQGYRWEVEAHDSVVAVFTDRTDAEAWAESRHPGRWVLRRVEPPQEE